MSLFPWTRHFRVPVATSSPQRTEYAHRLCRRHPRCRTATGPRRVRRTRPGRGRRTHQRVVPKGLLPGRGGVLLLGVRQDEGAIQGPRSHAHPRPAPLHRPTARHSRALRRGRCAARPGPAARADDSLLISRPCSGRRPPAPNTATKDLDNPHSCWSEGILVCLTVRRTYAA